MWNRRLTDEQAAVWRTVQRLAWRPAQCLIEIVKTRGSHKNTDQNCLSELKHIYGT